MSLHVNHSTVLRRLRSLQERMGVRLFERVPTGYAMTPAGEALAERLGGVGERIEAAQRQLGGLDLRLSGTIRLTSTDTLMHGFMIENHRTGLLWNPLRIPGAIPGWDAVACVGS